jgi:hypothetical protein
MKRTTTIGVGALAALALAGGAIAGASGNAANEQESGAALSDAERSAISTAALRATHGGRVNAMERDGENGATYEAEVTRTDGSTVDVRLDDHYGVVVVESDEED